MYNKFVSVLVVVLLALTPFLVLAQQSDVITQAVADAHRDAERVTDGSLWRYTGFFCSILGVGASFVYKPSIPAGALLGKSPQYVAHYTSEFYRETQGLQLYNATTGCVTSGALGIILIIVM